MNKILKASVSAMLVVGLVFGSIGVTPVTQAQENVQVQNENGQVQFETVRNDSEFIELKITENGDHLYGTIDLKTSEITMKTVEQPKSQLRAIFSSEVVTEYDVNVIEHTDTVLNAIIIERETKEEYIIQEVLEEKVQAQAPIIGIIRLLAKKYGDDMVKALRTAKKVKKDNDGNEWVDARDSDMKKFVTGESHLYYKAYVDHDVDTTVRIGDPIGYHEAQSRSANGSDVFCKTKIVCKNLAKGNSDVDNAIISEQAHGNQQEASGQFWHFHHKTNSGTNRSHYFYYLGT
ncbi:hypothetical protein [Paenibacillus agilis]|uniref:Cell wall hydrolase SleB domain-containing protein n=1 Tax=Paenibacillus agilis TaxID=3020863 RepID=A0A559J2E7_9BACL|nr:hypothetical protein [Paenibacillus agilis]TVX94064.1 hypothetical protein FPZ44_13965 [Paenibacillus agilis]